MRPKKRAELMKDVVCLITEFEIYLDGTRDPIMSLNNAMT